MKNIFLFPLCALFGFYSCADLQKNKPQAGVSQALAQERKKQLSDISYTLHFDIPENREAPVFATLKLLFNMHHKDHVILDFKANESQLIRILVNGSKVPVRLQNEHIVIMPKELQSGENLIDISFIAGDMSLNRNNDYLYTLLVPDRARTLFPCFDQPDLKAIYNLSLSIPEGWTAVANGRIAQISEVEKDSSKIRVDFEPTEPLSTYLFSFVAGQFFQNDYNNEGRPISIYHRNTDSEVMNQMDQIADQIYFCLHWMETYTGIPYPFAKYDAIILPGFQYGGMEHTGATLFNDKRLILGNHPTTEEELSRTELISHEIAHLWFGDYVTMKWFDDVWTKEVFAGYFASQMVEPLFPQINHKLNKIRQFIPPAYAEDRTQGAVAIKQPLENLQDAGLIYGKTIYNKAPMVMNMLADLLGADAFRLGLQEYLHTYAYANATWEDLMAILDQYTDENLTVWSHQWVHEKGMPEIDCTAPDGQYFIPNPDGTGYGFYKLDAGNLRYNMDHLSDILNPVTRLSAIINLHEHLIRRYVEPAPLFEVLRKQFLIEDNIQIISLLLNIFKDIIKLYNNIAILFENIILDIIYNNDKKDFKQILFNYFIENSLSYLIIDLYDIWYKQNPPNGIYITENQYISLSFELSVRLPELADTILQHQLLRLTHPDKIREFTFIAPALSPRKEVRDSVFSSLLQAKNREVEPWVVKSLHYLNHPLRQTDAIDYIVPALEVLPEIQRTGDIFLPSNWCTALLDGHTTPEAAQQLRNFLDTHHTMPPLLKNKILQAGDWLLRLPATTRKPPQN